MSDPDAVALQWVATVLACNEVTVMRGLREGGSPWLLQAGDREVVLRAGQSGETSSFTTEVAALSLATDAGVHTGTLSRRSRRLQTSAGSLRPSPTRAAPIWIALRCWSGATPSCWRH